MLFLRDDIADAFSCLNLLHYYTVNIQVSLLHHLLLLGHIIAFQPEIVNRPDSQKHTGHEANKNHHNPAANGMPQAEPLPEPAEI